MPARCYRRPVCGKARARLALAVAGLWLAAPWSVGLGAQGAVPSLGPATFTTCVTGVVEGVQSGAPAPTDRGFFETPDNLLGAVWTCAGNFAVATILPIGRTILGGLVVIMVVWTGVGFMFSGRFDFGSLLGTLFLAGLGFLLMDNYFYASPTVWFAGTTRGVVGLFAEEAVETSELIIGNADSRFGVAYNAARASAEETELGVRARIAGDPDRNYAAELDQPWPAESIGALLRRWTFEMRMVPLVFIKWISGLVLWLVGWMVYAQYVWGFFTLTVLTILGPLFIPWMMIPQLDFLFWGWVKAMINGVIYMLTAAALYAVTAMVLISPLERVAHAPWPTDPGSIMGVLELVFRMVTEWVPLVIMSLFAALKVGAVSGMIVGGGAMPGAGLGSALTKASAAAATYAGWRGGRGAGGVVGGDAPVSVLTGRQRAQQALKEARRRSGGGRRGPGSGWDSDFGRSPDQAGRRRGGDPG